MTRDQEIASALDAVRSRIAEAAARAQRRPDEVRLIAVSKKMPAEDVRAALRAGQQDFGENYAQELRDKRALLAADARAETGSQPGTNQLPAGPRWHYLGPIQSNKVKYLAGQVELIHSIDDGNVLVEIDRRLSALPTSSGSAAPRQACLVQVNIAGETRKGGVPPHQVSALLDRFAGSAHARCAGLMLIPPLSGDVDSTRRHFAALRSLAEKERAVTRPNVTLTELSMGMTDDFVEAVAEGATMVRIGTAIFGERRSV